MGDLQSNSGIQGSNPAQPVSGLSQSTGVSQNTGVQSPVYAPQSSQGLTKEHEAGSFLTVDQLIKPSESEPSISREEKEFGVESISQYPKLSEEHTKIGIKPAGDAVPVSTVPSGMVQLPMTKVKANSILKMHKKVSESILWLAILILKQIKIHNMKEFVF